MEEETIIIKAKRKKQAAGLASDMGSAGFAKVSYSKDRLVVEKTRGEDLSGRPHLEFRMVFLDNTIEIVYAVPAKAKKHSILLRLLPTIIDVLEIAEGYYQVQPSDFFSPLGDLFSNLSGVVDMDAIELRSELNTLAEKHERLSSRYEELVRSSEENTKILLECERKRDELASKLSKMRSMGDELLAEELYSWLKVHNGAINIREFAKLHSLDVSRVEEGLEMLIHGGYIKRKAD